jgi:spermidine synthase
LLPNPKLRLFVDDGRRWLLAHPQEKYDVIVANATFHWRDHSTTLLSTDFYKIIQEHLKPDGIYYFNATESDEAMATALSVFPYGLRVINFLAVSNSPITFDRDNWLGILGDFHIDGKAVFDPLKPGIRPVLAAYAAFPDTINETPRFLGVESEESLKHRLGRQRLITDDDMGREWASGVALPWRQ